MSRHKSPLTTRHPLDLETELHVLEDIQVRKKRIPLTFLLRSNASANDRTMFNGMDTTLKTTVTCNDLLNSFQPVVMGLI